MKHRFWLAVLGLALVVAPARSWWPRGHAIITRGALLALPSEVPAFFRSGGDLAAHLSYDPDVAKNRDTPNLRNAEDPEHYVDLELLAGTPLPPTRYQFLKLCGEKGLDPSNVGLVPYSTTEWTERLAVAFAEHRKWPNNPQIRTKCLVYAGILAHYAGDLCMPLHVTIHFNGRAKPDHSSPRTGIHERMDSLIERLELKPADLAREQRVDAVQAIFPAVTGQIQNSFGKIDRVYELEAKLPPRDEKAAWTPGPEARQLGEERGREAVRFLASLYLTAWKRSASLTLPPWLEREAGPAPSPAATR